MSDFYGELLRIALFVILPSTLIIVWSLADE